MAASEIFVRAAAQLNGVFSAEGGRLSFGNGVPTALVQNVNASYMQNVTRLYEVGNNTTNQGGAKAGAVGVANVYYVGGRTQGTMGMARVVGPSTVLKAYYTKFGDVCQAKTNTIQLYFKPLACQTDTFAVYTCAYCVIVQLGISVAAQDLVVNENSQLMFSSMTYDENTGAAQGPPVNPLVPLPQLAGGAAL
jgi:hypothetical protein